MQFITNKNIPTTTNFDTSNAMQEQQGATKLGTTDQKLSDIATKLLANQGITEPERNILKDVRAMKIEKGNEKLTSTQKKTIEVTKSLAKNIISRKGVHELNQQKANEMLRQLGGGSLAEQMVKAKLLQALDESRGKSYFSENIGSLINKKTEAFENKLINLIQKHNNISPAIADKAGTLAFQEGVHKVYYNSQGKLILAIPDRKITTPVELEKSNMKLKPQQLDIVKSIYQNIVDTTPYNNVGPMLEFMKFYREASGNNPKLTLSEAFEGFQVYPEDIHNKYHSGDCVIIAGKITSELKANGFEAAITGQLTGPPWSKPPVPDQTVSPFWDKYDAETENVHHCCTVLRYTNEEGKDLGMNLDVVFEGKDIPKAPQKYSDLTVGKTKRLDNISNPGHILKMQMKGKYKMMMTGVDGMHQQFGVDFMRENIYVNSDGVKGLKGLPLQQNERFSISLQSLKYHLDEKATYYIDGHPQVITNREALALFQEIAGKRFQLPNDFAENIITLAKSSDLIVNEILISTVATAKAVQGPANEAYRLVKLADEKSKDYVIAARLKETPEGTKNLMESFIEKKIGIRLMYQQLQDSIIADDPETVRQLAEKVKIISEELNRIVGEIEAVPKELAEFL